CPSLAPLRPHMYPRQMVRNLRELHQYRALLWSLTQRELKARYRGSVLGFLWTFLNPMLLMLVYSLLFSVYMRNSMNHYTYFLFIGLLPWIWFSSSVGAGASAISDRRDLLTKVRFPAQVLPATVVASNLVNYLLSLPLMVLLGGAYGVWPTWHVVAFPLVLAIQLLFTLGISYLISALNVGFRDLQHIVGNLLTLTFFLTPVLYSYHDVQQKLAHYPALASLVLYGNPMAVIVRSYQAIFYEQTLPSLLPLAGVLVVSLALLWISAHVFESRREEFAELV
ncbi:MAG TPA: ABC transporter permease, partial [Myxococcaceae bacterium]|nr:ABC transporter permease [Myxococcaceae bacterium]